MGWDEISNSVCPIARALALVGDRWTMLILMELVRGMHRFDELQAQTGMSSHLLSTRLKRMEADGLIERRAYSERPLRYEYYSTEKGKGLDPVLLMLRTWGRQWEGDCPDGQPATLLRHKASGQVVDDLFQLPGGGRDFRFDQLEATPGPAFAAERAKRREAFYGRGAKALTPEDGPAPEHPAKPALGRGTTAAVKPAAEPARKPAAKSAAVRSAKPASKTKKATSAKAPRH
jgi:DNA-binding HxlR family transcriptional regulator